VNVGKPLKILQFNTFYRPFLEDFYKKNPGLENLSHTEQQKHLYQSGFSVVHNFIPGLWQLGYEALFVVANNWHSQSKWMSENGFACNNGSMWPYEILAQQINCFRPDVVLAFDAFMFDGDFFKQLSWHPLLVIGWTGEYVPDNINWDGYDLILSNFSFPRKKAVELGAAKSEQFYPGFVEWLADGSVHNEPAFDVVFCGQWSGLHEKRNTFLLDIVRKNSSNNNFSLRYHLLGNYEQMPAEVRRVIQPPVFGVEMHQVLRRSKIALNFGYLPEAGNMRQFEVTGTGVFLLTENLQGLDSYFKPGVEVETFSSIDEVMEKIDYYLKHETERELIAAAGQRRCLRDHSMTVQVRKLDEIIRRNLSEKSGVNLRGLNANESLINVSRVVPVSRKFGFDRGTPIDRFYIDKFLSGNASLIAGEVLEVAGKDYSLGYGRDVQHVTVLSVAPGAGVDLVGNLETGENIPSEKFDCIILTQTMQMIFDVRSALRHSYMALKPGGSILLTASGISQISRYDMDRWGEYWRFTDKSMDRLITELLPLPEFEIKTYGNVGVAKAFLDGLAFEELPAESLSFNDPDYQLLVAARITKPATVSLRREEKNEKASMVLIYHRVADDPVDRNLLTVSPDNFAEHLKILQNEFRPVPLRQFLDEAEKGKLIPGTVSLTFDDGYLDNLLNALPLLEKYRVPATVFVVSGMIGSQREFWWDAMERVFLADPQRQLPERIVFMGSDGEEKGWRTVSKAERLRAHDEICTMLRGNSVAEINEFVEKIFLWAGERRPPRKSHLVLSELELRELSESPMIEIGAHTVNHSRLTALPISEQKIEIESRGSV